MPYYHVTVKGYADILVVADSEDEALEKAYDYGDPGLWLSDERKVSHQIETEDEEQLRRQYWDIAE